MSSDATHCPFLNRADSRCSDAFNIDNLDHAFRYCFGRYTSCPVYAELLVERRMKRFEAALPESAQRSHDGEQIIQVSVHRTSLDRKTPGESQHSFAQSEAPSESAGASSVPALPRIGKRSRK
jgi:hypothetical protein